MARPKEFDEHAAIGRAMDAFWARGYEGTSTQALCEATGLGRSSIYNTFTSKHQLFMRTLDHYAERGIEGRTALLENAGTGIERFRSLFTFTIEEEIAHDRLGCLMVNTVAEFGGRDPEISARIDGAHAVPVGSLRSTVRSTGKVIESPFTIQFEVNDDGLITKYLLLEDSWHIADAVRP